MTKNLQNFLIKAMMGLSATIVAQPSLNSSNTNPTIGENFVWKTASYMSPGPAGASQTWNFSAMSPTATTNYTVMNPNSTPNGSSFPSSNLAFFEGTNYAYYTGLATSYLNFGAYAGGVAISYTNAETMLSYPCNFNSTSSDSWGGTFVNNSVTFYRTGTTTVTADGYGSCTTPAGTFTNVMRIHYRQVYKDSTAGPIIINYDNDEYVWYRQGTHYPIAIVYSFTTTSFSSPQVSTYGGYLNNVIAGIEEVSEKFSHLNLFPNPASGVINLTVDANDAAKVEYVICNSLGQVVKTPVASDISVSANNSKITISDLSQGIYFLQIRYEGALVKSQRFVVAH